MCVRSVDYQQGCLGHRGKDALALGAVLLLTAPPLFAQQPSATVSVGPPVERSLGHRAGHVNHRFHEQTANFGFGPLPYTISYQACVDPAHGDQVAPLEGYVGMPRPTACNWYHSGFLFIELNGQDIGTTPLSSMQVAESDTRAILDLVWHHELADVRLRFLGLPEHDGLFCELTLDPRQELTSVVVKLRCYPSFFTAWQHRDGARRIRTPGSLIKQGEAKTVPAGDNWWAVYYDEVFDVARGEGAGPCAMMLRPTPGATITFAPQSYQVDTRITCPGDTRRLRMAFWDLSGVANSEALRRFDHTADAVRQQLAEADFTPAALTHLDLADLRAQVQSAVATPAVRDMLGGKLAAIQAWLAESTPTSDAEARDRDVRTQEILLQHISDYYAFRWEIRLAELLAGI